ncbi:16S rRNA (guanine(527)-N(7))-methyltransferase RsmG [Ciceribacter sp. L1K23]|uniref:16S rRNA (guanine(527)-N(7))-methyltransferase RsmG n=1 Tax=Ciceribacter sp. L1K23 TaxID=2820276 RepID=UPI001B8328FA|nr:16S rRNA (guanine(527)-N(7))-methyltransferase RsmG [Ciceribacter sp. L1K23]
MNSLSNDFLDGVSRETVDKLQVFVDCLEKWSAKINLIGPSTKKDVWTRHIADSLQLASLVELPKRWIDLGSGAGFPGLIIAILMAERGDGWVHLVESNQKKASFLRAALLETGGRGEVHAVRIEDFAKNDIETDIVSARALASLDMLFEYSAPWLSQSARGLFHKGRDYRAEIDKARDRWQFDLVLHRSAIEADSVILDVKSLARNY